MNDSVVPALYRLPYSVISNLLQLQVMLSAFRVCVFANEMNESVVPALYRLPYSVIPNLLQLQVIPLLKY